jgi:GTP-binding protein
VYPVSAINGSGTGELLDEVVKVFDKNLEEDIPDLPKFAVVGRPNVGKSSLVNAFLGDDRNIVTPLAGTTRDSIYTRYNSFGFDFLLVDTAGLRKKGKVKENIEFYSVLRSIRAIENSDVCFLLVDASVGFDAQDQNIFGLITKNKKGVVIVVNKWDLIEKESKTHLIFEKKIREKIAPFRDVPILFTSVPSKQRIFKTLETGAQVYKNLSTKIPTAKLNDLLLPVIERKPTFCKREVCKNQIHHPVKNFVSGVCLFL